MDAAPGAQPAMIVANASSTTVRQRPREVMMHQPVAGPSLGKHRSDRFRSQALRPTNPTGVTAGPREATAASAA